MSGFSFLIGLLDANKNINIRLLLFLMAVITTVYACDLETQYQYNGMCCKMCEPGTMMVNRDNCEDPMCKPCPEGEYQVKYTAAEKCELQPYCDPNKNLRLKNGKSLTRRGQCACKTDFHCSSERCVTCIPNTRCTPGQDILLKGNHTHDTVCQSCPHGTYSSDGIKCLKWKTCEAGDKAQEMGTDQTDTICVKENVAVGAIVAGVLLLLLLPIGFVVWKNKGSILGFLAAWGICQTGRVESCIKLRAQEVNDIATGQPDINPGEPLLAQPEAENGLGSIAVENEETQPPVQTENGHMLEQEHGKSDIVSQSDSSFDSFQFSSCP